MTDIAADGRRLELVAARDHNGEDAFYLLALTEEGSQELDAALAGTAPILDLAAFGEVLHSGYGRPDAAALQLMRTRFGFTG